VEGLSMLSLSFLYRNQPGTANVSSSQSFMDVVTGGASRIGEMEDMIRDTLAEHGYYLEVFQWLSGQKEPASSSQDETI
jgi:hypothetical protein